MRFIVFAFMIAISPGLLACVITQPFNEVGACPPVKNWTVDEQKEAAAELKALPDNAILNAFMLDYERMRKQSMVASPTVFGL